MGRFYLGFTSFLIGAKHPYQNLSTYIKMKKSINLTKKQFGRLILHINELKKYGFSVKLDEFFVISCFPYLKQDIYISLNSYNFLELNNLIEVLLGAVRYGVSTTLVNSDGKNNVRGKIVYKFPLILDIQSKVITLDLNIRYFLDSLDPNILIETYFEEIHKIFPNDYETVLDVGAAFGDTALYYLRRGKKVIALEPVNYGLLTRNVDFNGITKDFTAYEVAIGSNGTLKIHKNNSFFDGGAAAFGNNINKTFVNVNSMSLSRFFDTNSIRYVDLAKFDCKGCEFSLDANDLSYIKKYLIIEYLTMDSQSLSKLLKRLEDSGFNFQIKSVNYHYVKGMNLTGTIIAYRLKPSDPVEN